MDSNSKVISVTMNKEVKNPFSNFQPDHQALWEILMLRDIHAFVRGDWKQLNEDFIVEGFTGINACKSFNPTQWVFAYPTLKLYKKEWLKQAHQYIKKIDINLHEQLLHDISNIHQIIISKGTACVLKRFNGTIDFTSEIKEFQWQTLYFCKKLRNRWKISGFIGYLPLGLNGKLCCANIALGKNL